jgi:hemoglobin
MLRAAVFLLAVMGAMPARADDSLYRALGGKDVIVRISDATIEMSVNDPRIAHTFDEVNVKRVKRLLADQICELTGGPCVYEGRTMQESHYHLDLTDAHFNWLVEHLQDAMDRERIPFRTQNKLLAILAPLRRDIVKRDIPAPPYAAAK